MPNRVAALPLAEPTYSYFSPTLPSWLRCGRSSIEGPGQSLTPPAGADHTAEPVGLQPPPSRQAPLLPLPVSRCSTARLPSGVAFAAADPLQDPRQISPLQRLQTRRNRGVIRNAGLVQRWVMGKLAIGKLPCGVVYRPVWLREID